MRTDINGTSTCPNGEERYECFSFGPRRNKRYQYDYRTKDGELFSCVDKTLEKCRKRRDGWLKQKGKEPLCRRRGS